jgi:hypothetical protein
VRAATEAQRRRLVALRADGTIGDAAFQRVEEELDWAELDWAQLLTFRGQSRTVTRASMVLGHVVDMADHYSQIANYMRLNNIVPPTALPRPPARP